MPLWAAIKVISDLAAYFTPLQMKTFFLSSILFCRHETVYQEPGSFFLVFTFFFLQNPFVWPICCASFLTSRLVSLISPYPNNFAGSNMVLHQKIRTLDTLNLKALEYFVLFLKGQVVKQQPNKANLFP